MGDSTLDNLDQKKYFGNTTDDNSGLNNTLLHKSIEIDNNALQINEKYNQILEQNKALKRKVKELDNWLDFREMDFNQKLQDFNRQRVISDKNQVNYKFETFKDLLSSYNKCMNEVSAQLHPTCQVRSNFNERLVNSYTNLFSSLKTYHCSEMTKYVVRINSLVKKNKIYEAMIEEHKKKDAKMNENTNFKSMKDKLDSMEKEISISSIFARDTEDGQGGSFMSLIAKKAEDLDGDFDPNAKNALAHLQEVLGTMYALIGSPDLLSSKMHEKSGFNLREWESDFATKFTKAQFGAAKSTIGIMNNKEKYKVAEVQTDEDPLLELLEERKTQIESLTCKCLQEYCANL